MFILKEVKRYEVLRCSLSRAYMFYGDWYYEEEETGKIVLYDVYHRLREEEKEKKFNYDRLLNAQSNAEYKAELKRYEEEVLEMNILDDVDQ